MTVTPPSSDTVDTVIGEKVSLRRIRVPPALRATIYVGIIASLVYALSLLLPQDPVTYRVFRGRMRSVGLIASPEKVRVSSERSANEIASDPHLNAEMPEGGVFDQLRHAIGVDQKQQGHKSTAYLLVYVGDCASCLAFDVQKCEHAAAQHNLSLVLLSTGSAKEVKKFRDQIATDNSKIIFISDPKQQLVGTLNAQWQPRCYLLSKDLHLLWLQKSSQAYYDPFVNQDFLDVLR